MVFIPVRMGLGTAHQLVRDTEFELGCDAIVVMVMKRRTDLGEHGLITVVL